jgi:hypothetical protein
MATNPAHFYEFPQLQEPVVSPQPLDLFFRQQEPLKRIVMGEERWEE